MATRPAPARQLADLQQLLDQFRHGGNTTRPHRSLPHRTTPAALYDTLRIHGQLRHIGIGRTHNRTHVILLVQDLEVRVINAITGELLRELTIDATKD